MTQPPPPPMQPEPAPMGPPTFQPVPPKKRKLPWILGGVALVLLLCFGGCGAILASGDKTPSGKQVERTSAAPAAQPATTSAAPAPVKTTAAAPRYGTPKPADFKLTVKELEKQCFGSAGCNLQFRISKVAYNGPELDPDASYEVSYAYKGLTDPMTGTFTLTGDGSYEVEQMEFGQTASSGKKVTAVVTAVEKM